MSDSEATGGTSSPRLKASLLVDEGNYYEAHQRYKALYFRYMRSKKYNELKEIMFDGALLLLTKGQETSGTEIADLFLSMLIESKMEPSFRLFKDIEKLLPYMKENVADRNKFVTKALKWSSGDGHSNGHPELHKVIAQFYWKEQNYQLARHHYLYSCDGPGYARMLVQLHITHGYEWEIDLFITQVVLQYLCLRKKTVANDVFEVYVEQHPNIDGPPFILPLLNFLCFLLKIVDSGKLTTFIVLCDKYQIALKRDPTYPEYLERIAEIFFNVKPMLMDAPCSSSFGDIMGLLGINDGESLQASSEDPLLSTPY